MSPGKLSAQTGTWKFVVFGDSISLTGSDVNTNILGELAGAVVNERPDFLLFLGDCSLLGSAAGYELWTNVMAPVYGARISVYPAVGNHDRVDPAAYTNIIATQAPDNGPPGEAKTTYSFCHSNALFLVLNQFAVSNEWRVNQSWVDAVLSTNTMPHVFVAGHVPAFRVYHPDCLEQYLTNRDAFWNSLSNAHCHAYFSGHDHFYDHAQLEDGDSDPQNDLHQVIIGTGGAPLYPDAGYMGTNSIWTPLRRFHEAQWGYVAVEVDTNDVTMTWHHRTGANGYPAAEVFSYSIIPRLFLRHRFEAGYLTLTWSGEALLERSADASGQFAGIPSALSPYVITNLSETSVFYRLVAPGP